MRSILATDLVQFCSAQLAQSASEDLFYFWLEEALTIVSEQTWSWNWKHIRSITLASVKEEINIFTSVANTFTWTEGDEYLLCSGVVTIPHSAAGRMVKLDDEWYKAIDFGFAIADRVRLDRPIVGSRVEPTELTFHRTNLAIQTTKIRTVELSAKKIHRYSTQFWTQNFLGSHRQADISTSYAYTEIDYSRLTRPAYPPVVVNGIPVADFPAGEFYYFYTRYDSENRLESAPGPMTKFTSTAGIGPSIVYGNPSGNLSEDTSYQLRLYRSDINPTRDRVAMFLIASRDPTTVVAYVDNSRTVYNLPRYWDASYTVVEFFPPPDDTRVSINVECLNNWAPRLYEQEYLELGSDNQVMELIRIFLTGVVNLAGRNTAEYRQAAIHFRSQMAYLVTTSRSSGDGDYGPENWARDIPGPDGSGDWVDALRWQE